LDLLPLPRKKTSMTTNFNAEQVLADFKNWQQMLKQYQVPSYSKAAIQIANSFAIFLGLWAAQFYLYDYSVLFIVLIGLVNGFILGRIFIIQHDCGHRSFTKNQTINDIIGTFCSVCTFIPYNYWARSHDFHHAHNGQLEFSDIGDVQCLTSEEYAALPLGRRIYYQIYRNPLYLFTIGGFIYVVLYNRFALLRGGNFEKARRSVTVSNVVFVLMYAAFAWVLGWQKFLVVQFVNLFFFGTYALWFFYIQHQYENIYKNTKDNWSYVLSAVKGSTYYNLPYFMHWLTGNIGYHHIHHLCPTIPNYNLRACHKNVPAFEKHANAINFWESLKTVKANLWDTEDQKMISFSDFNRKYGKKAA
jgi:acyl-lipid omega-6 desaturase (Delta-12 desaturase)